MDAKDPQRYAIELYGARTLVKQCREQIADLLEKYPELNEPEREQDAVLQHMPRLAIPSPKGLLGSGDERAELLNAAKRAASANGQRRTRRTFTQGFRNKVLAHVGPGMSITKVARKYDLSQSLVYYWARAAGANKAAKTRTGAKSKRAKPNGAVVKSADVGRETVGYIVSHGGRVGLKDICKALGMKEDSMRYRLRVRKKAGHLLQHDDGTWEVTPDGIQFANRPAP